MTPDATSVTARKGIIPAAQHRVCDKASGHSSANERFNYTLQQRVSRLLQETPDFSKSLHNHMGAIKYFTCLYNLEVIGFV